MVKDDAMVGTWNILMLFYSYKEQYRRSYNSHHKVRTSLKLQHKSILVLHILSTWSLEELHEVVVRELGWKEK